MQEKGRRGQLAFSGMTLIFIFLIVYCNFILSGYLSGNYGGLAYIMTSISAFLCSLLLQGEEIVGNYRQRKSLIFRGEMFFLGTVTFLFGFMKLWYMLLFSDTTNLAVTATVAVVLGGNMDLIFMFLSGIFFVRAYYRGEGLTERDRKKYFLLYLSILFIIVMADYCNVWFFQSSFSQLSSFAYILYFSNIFKIFIFALALQIEKILKLICNKTGVVIYWNLVALGIVAFMFAVIKIWLALFLHNINSSIIQSINGSDLWQVAYMFAAGMLLVRSFQIKAESNDLEDMNQNTFNNDVIYDKIE